MYTHSFTVVRRTWFLATLALAWVGCGEGMEDGSFEEELPQEVASEPVEQPVLDTATDDVFSDRPVLVAEPAAEAVPAPVPFDMRRSLAVTDKAILSAFTLQRVFDQLVAQNGAAGRTSAQLFRQLWDTQNPGPNLGWGAHCNDGSPTDMNAAAYNKFPYACRQGEGQPHSGTPTAAPTITLASYFAIGLFNRFDLAPSNGATCGEYRIAFAKNSSSSGRNLLIFEASLPNPRPELGIEGCRPVVDFWRNLSAQADILQRRAALESFYFTGLTGFSPVVHMNNYGNNSRRAGQLRTNQFMGGQWMLREFKLMRLCPTTGCTLRFDPVTDKTNPWGPLFKASSTHPLASEFRTWFVTQVPTLARNTIHTFAYSVPDKYNSGQSISDFFPSETHYLNHFAAGGTGSSNTFRTQIQTKLTSIGSTLTPEDIVARAQALSCSGCHQNSAGTSLGGGLSFPQSQSFTHVSEFNDPADSTRFRLSDALLSTFLPRRQVLVEGFLNTPAENSVFVSQTVPTSVVAGQSFTVTITMKNTGNTSWKESTGFRLATLANNWGVTRARLASTDTLIKTQQKAFTFTVTAPSTPGTYAFKWRMVHDGATGVFGAITPVVNITVQAAATP
jgi:hypothetical protein